MMLRQNLGQSRGPFSTIGGALGLALSSGKGRRHEQARQSAEQEKAQRTSQALMGYFGGDPGQARGSGPPSARAAGVDATSPGTAGFQGRGPEALIAALTGSGHRPEEPYGANHGDGEPVPETGAGCRAGALQDRQQPARAWRSRAGKQSHREARQLPRQASEQGRRRVRQLVPSRVRRGRDGAQGLQGSLTAVRAGLHQGHAQAARGRGPAHGSALVQQGSSRRSPGSSRRRRTPSGGWQGQQTGGRRAATWRSSSTS